VPDILDKARRRNEIVNPQAMDKRYGSGRLRVFLMLWGIEHGSPDLSLAATSFLWAPVGSRRLNHGSATFTLKTIAFPITLSANGMGK